MTAPIKAIIRLPQLNPVNEKVPGSTSVRRKLPTTAPMTPTMMSPMIPSPVPRTSKLASKPAIPPIMIHAKIFIGLSSHVVPSVGSRRRTAYDSSCLLGGHPVPWVDTLHGLHELADEIARKSAISPLVYIGTCHPAVSAVPNAAARRTALP